MDKKLILTILIILGVLGITFSAVIIFFFGLAGLWKVIRVIGIIVIVALFIAFAVYLTWYFFIKKHKFDVTAVNRKKLVMAGKMQCPTTLYNRHLKLSGDKGHSWILFGRIKGYLRIHIMMRQTKYDKKREMVCKTDEYGREIPEYELYAEEQDIFIIKKGVFPFNLFLDEEVVRVNPNDHDELIGDVTLFGLNLLPISEYWFLASDYLNVRKIDRAILLEAERGVLFEMLKDTKTIVDQAINLDQKHRKIIEEKSLMEIPQLQQLTGNK